MNLVCSPIMGARQAVLLTPPKSSVPIQLLSRQQSALLHPEPRRVTPLAATLTQPPLSVANTRLTQFLSPLAATLTKNRGWGHRLAHSHRSPSRRIPLFPKWSAIATPSFPTPPFNFRLSIEDPDPVGTINLPSHSPPASHPPLAARIRAAAIQGVPHV